MKNQNKGFVVPLLIAVIAVLVIGGGIYVYTQNKNSDLNAVDNQNLINNYPAPSIPTNTDIKENVASNNTPSVAGLVSENQSEWKTYNNTEFGISFKYPEDIFKSPIIQRDNTNPKYASLVLEYKDRFNKAGVLRDGFKISFDSTGDYEHFKAAYDKNPNIYDPFVLGGKSGYKELDSSYGAKKGAFEGKNILHLFKTNTPWFVQSIHMNIYNISNKGEGGLELVSDKDNNQLFESIIRTVKFI